MVRTRTEISDGKYPISYGGFCFLPKQASMQTLWKEAQQVIDQGLVTLDEGALTLFPDPHNCGPFSIVVIERAWDNFKWKHPDKNFPPWAKNLPDSLVRHMLRKEALDGDMRWIINAVPSTKIDYTVYNQTIVPLMYDILGMHRLFGVRQLGFLRYPFTSNVATMPIPHSRGVHQIDTAAIGLAMMRNMPNFKKIENTLTIAFCAHDACTPAGSDTTKYIDPIAFDEELNFNTLFDKPGWKQARDMYKISEELLYRTVRGEGITGKLLDIADKVAYTARDASFFINSNFGEEYYAGNKRNFGEMKKIAKQNPYFTSVWDDVIIYGDELVFTDPHNLRDFLKIRAYMTAELYKSSHARVIENLLARKLIKIPYDAGEITAKNLLSWTDAMLEDFLRNKYGISFYLTWLSKSKYIECKTADERNKLITEISENMLPVVDDFPINSHSGTKKFNVLWGNDIRTFADAYPEASKEIDEILNSRPSGFPLYLVSREDLHINNDGWRLIKEHK